MPGMYLVSVIVDIFRVLNSETTAWTARTSTFVVQGDHVE